MASIWWEQTVAAPADAAWAALRQLDRTHEIFSPVLVDGSIAGDVRTVTFANGMVVHERIIDVDEQRRRLCYGVIGEMFHHHSASMQIIPVDEASCRFIWISDFLPNEQMDMMLSLIKQGALAFAENLASRPTGLKLK